MTKPKSVYVCSECGAQSPVRSASARRATPGARCRKPSWRRRVAHRAYPCRCRRGAVAPGARAAVFGAAAHGRERARPRARRRAGAGPGGAHWRRPRNRQIHAVNSATCGYRPADHRASMSAARNRLTRSHCARIATGLRGRRRAVKLTENQVENILGCARDERPQVMVVDSIQTMFTDMLESALGASRRCVNPPRNWCASPRAMARRCSSSAT